MPNVILDRISLPNLRLYTSVSAALVACCLYYAIHTTSDPLWRMHNNVTSGESFFSLELVFGGDANEDSHPLESITKMKEGESINIEYDGPMLSMLGSAEFVDSHKTFKPSRMNSPSDQRRMIDDTRTIGTKIKDIVSFMVQEPICVWTIINMAYCGLILLGKTIQRMVFGELRISEQQHLKDKFWNFVFYKFIFVFGVVNVQFLHEVVLWVSWYSILGFLHLISQLCRERFEYLSFSPSTAGWSHFRLVGLLLSILVVSGFMFIICIGVGIFGGINTFAFMAAECIMLSVRTFYVLIRYGIFLNDMRQDSVSAEAFSRDKRGRLAYYMELTFDLVILLIDLLHHLHMLVWSNILLSMASLVIVMQLRYLVHEIQRKVKKHRNYLWVQNHMERTYPLATASDLSQNSDNCAICWEKMETARKLPCSHLFHNSCLQSWLEQDTSCPTCRLGLSVQNSANMHANIERIIDDQEANTRANNHFFHFNGSRYVSWLPNFSVEVTHINNVLRASPGVASNPAVAHTSQLRNMARQVQQMFPRYPLSTIISDLQLSHSMEVTIDNILEGRLLPPPRHEFDDDDAFGDYMAVSNEAPSTSDTNAEPNTANGSADIGYEIERSTNIFGNQNDLLRDDGAIEELSLGERFTKSHTEREKILQQRKESMLSLARKRYLEKNVKEVNLDANS